MLELKLNHTGESGPYRLLYSDKDLKTLAMENALHFEI